MPRNQNLTEQQAAAKRAAAAAAGLVAKTGPHPGTGSAYQLDVAIAEGRAVVLLMTEETPILLTWLNEQRETLDYNSPLCREIDRIIAALWTARVMCDG